MRHCVECPACLTRYLIGFSPYRNGSYLVPVAGGFQEEWALHCICGATPSRWHWSELKMYAVSSGARRRGYGVSKEIVNVANLLRGSS